MRTECRRSPGVATVWGISTHELWAFARLGCLFAVFAGMLAFAATKHSHVEATLKPPVIRPA